jgi:multidrug efflux pump subunit AcrB
VTTPAVRPGLIAWFAENHVAANLLMLLIILTGLFSAATITRKSMPDVDLPVIQVRMAYPGAAPADVESGIVIQIEKAVDDIDGITRVSSVASEGLASVTIEVDEARDINEVLNDVKVRIDSILTFPVDAEPAIVSRNLVRNDALRLEVFGDLDPASQKELAQQIRDELLRLPQVTTVSLAGDRPYEISIELPRDTLLKYGLSLDQVAQRIRQSSLDLPAGTLDTQGGEILVRTQALAYDYRDFEAIVLLTGSDGTRLTLGDIASIHDGFEDSESYARFNGHPTISLNVQITGNQNLLEVTDVVKNYVAERRLSLPPGIQLEVWNDASRNLRDRLDLMTDNMLTGALLVFLILSMFLHIRLAFWVMVGIPLSMLGALALMPQFGIDLNMLSLFGFIMVLGIVVDDAIIIGESVHHSIDRYGPGLASVIHGARKVVLPATFGVLTTIVAFVPLLMISGFAASFTAAIGGVVILALGFSLVESKLILPAHLAHMKQDAGPQWLQRLQTACNASLERFVQRCYLPWNRVCLRHRYSTLAGFVAMLILMVGVVGGGLVRVVFLPEIQGDSIQASITMVEGSPEAQSRAILQRVEEAAQSLNGRFEFRDSESGELSTQVVEHILVVSSSVSSGSATIALDTDVSSQIDTDLLTQYLLDYVGNMPGLKSLTFSAGVNIGGTPIAFQLVSDNAEQLTAAANELERQLRSYNGLINIRNEAVSNKDELRLSPKPQADAIGLSLNDISSQVRNAFYGAQAQRMQRGDDEVRVMVRYPENERVSIGDLEQLMLRSSNGDAVPFDTVAEFSLQPGYARINRVNGERSVAVSADAVESLVEPGEVLRDLEDNFFPGLFQRYPSVDYRSDGGTAEQQSIVEDLIRGMLLAIFGIYALLAIPLRSYMQPLIIMSVIPFGVIGAILGHWLLGIPLNFLSVLGIIALSGVVVNDSIVIVDFINQARAEGTELLEAVLNSGAARFRAILLTSLTTFAGLAPILLERSMQAQFLIPMAASLAFGIMFATGITLFLIPSLYMILADLKGETRGSTATAWSPADKTPA